MVHFDNLNLESKFTIEHFWPKFRSAVSAQSEGLDLNRDQHPEKNKNVIVRLRGTSRGYH